LTFICSSHRGKQNGYKTGKGAYKPVMVERNGSTKTRVIPEIKVLSAGVYR
jgi:hypothetical protein